MGERNIANLPIPSCIIVLQICDDVHFFRRKKNKDGMVPEFCFVVVFCVVCFRMELLTKRIELNL